MRSFLFALCLGLSLTGCDFPMGGCEYSSDTAAQLRIAQTDDLIPRLVYNEFPSRRAEDIQPQFFPDGERILYRSGIRDARTGRRIGALPLGGDEPAFGPDGARIALIRDHYYPNNSGPDDAPRAPRSNLTILHLDTEDTLRVHQDLIQVTDSTWTETRHFGPQWLSADKIVHRTEVRTYERTAEGGPGDDRSFRQQLRLTTLDGVSRILVADSVAAFSTTPGSSHIVYSTPPVYGNPSYMRSVKVLDVSTGQSTRIGTGQSPLLSPDGNQIAYLSQINANRFTLWLYNRMTRTQTRLADSVYVPFALGSRPNNMVFSPGGSRIAFLDNGRPKAIHLIEATAPHQTQSFYIDCGSPNADFNCEDAIDPQFSPDGSRILLLLAGRETYDCAE